mmetsp:Transcript_26697/g.61504  ORF Transcript_26697/g.61504 Transcript_26697/m.61504 type:complete len:222 (+) Transcript_26697:2-667(+)
MKFAFALLAAVGIVAMATPAFGTYFHVTEGGMKCLLEEVPEDTLVIGTYKSPDQTHLPAKVKSEGGKEEAVGMLVEVTDPSNTLMLSHITEPTGRFAFTSQVSGLHKMCVHMNVSRWWGHKVMRFDLDLTVGEQPVDFAAVAKREHVTAVEIKVMKLTEKLKAIQHDIGYFRNRERAFRDTSESSNARAMWFSIFQIVGMLVLSFIQIRYLRNYFISKKVV